MKKDKIRKRTLDEAENIIKDLQQKLWARDKVLSNMRMALYYAKKFLKEVECELDGMWYHGIDGSDLLVSKDELFDTVQNKIITAKLVRGMNVIDKPLLELKQFIGW
jgi:hypothetical protein